MSEAQTGNTNKLRVLLLEDSAFDAEILNEWLKRCYAEVQVIWVQDEPAFVDALAHGSFDVILSDYELPGFSGAQALDHARRQQPELPFIFVSGVIGEDNAVDMLKRGAIDYVIKGRLSRLPMAIDRALDEVRERQAREAAVTQLREAKEEAERANRSKDRFLAMLSHELRTPLSPIMAAAHMLERVATVPEKASHLLPMIRRNVALEARLIDDLLDLTAIGAGKVNLRLQPVDLHRLVHAVVEMLDEDFRRGQIMFEIALDAPHSTVHGDEARLQQVLWNIVRNAVKFTPAGGRVTVSTRLNGDAIEVRCTDTGIGIHADALPRILLPFEQADPDVSKRFGGLGLGLAIAQGLITRHNGSLHAGSDGRDKGSTFTLRLPLAADGATVDSPLNPAAGAPIAPRDVRLLLVEDNHDAADAMSISLAEQGYRVTHAATREQAFELLSREGFHIVVTDIGLPDGSGIEIGRRFSKQLPVIALSGYGTQGDLKLSTDAGFAAHLVKPVAPGVVHAAVQAALAGR